MHCHGLNGDGRGPTGPWVNPHPRLPPGQVQVHLDEPDRVEPQAAPADLVRTVAKGIEGTSMPAFGVYSEKDIDEIVSYVIHLSIRGQVEYDTIENPPHQQEGRRQRQGSPRGRSIKTHVYGRAALILAALGRFDQRPPIRRPPPTPTRGPTPDGRGQDLKETAVRNGYQLFLNANKGGCISCHTDFGRQVPYNYDDWGTLVQPRNLTTDNYRGDAGRSTSTGASPAASSRPA